MLNEINDNTAMEKWQNIMLINNNFHTDTTVH